MREIARVAAGAFLCALAVTGSRPAAADDGQMQPSARVIVLDAPVVRSPTAPRGAPTMTPILADEAETPAPAKVRAAETELAAEKRAERAREPRETGAIAKPKVVTYSRDTRPGFYW